MRGQPFGQFCNDDDEILWFLILFLLLFVNNGKGIRRHREVAKTREEIEEQRK